jgi:hypothetical protein
LIDQNAIAALVQQQINEAVKSQISSLLADPEWISRIEKRAVDVLANKIEARFTRLNEDPELSQAVHSGIRALFEHGFVPDITRYVDSKKFQQSVDTGVQNAVTDVIGNLSLDSLWLSRVETMISQQMHIKVNRYISELQIESTISNCVGGALDRWLEANPVVRTQGIDDQAGQTELTVMDGVVVIEGELAAKQITVTQNAQVQGQLSVQDLDITGTIDVTAAAWNQIGARASQLALAELTNEWRQNLVGEVADMIRDRGMDLAQVTINGQALLQDGRLSSEVQHSGLRTVGTLEDLDVTGAITTDDTVIVRNKDSVLSLGSQDGRAGWIGSNGDLQLGAAGQPQITLGADGITTINQIRIGGLRIGAAAQVPGYRGNRGDIVFNSEPAQGTPFAWICLGAFSWQPVRGVQ